MNVMIHLSDRYIDRIIIRTGLSRKGTNSKIFTLATTVLTTRVSNVGRKWYFFIPMGRPLNMHTKKLRLSVIKNSLCQRDQSARSLVRTRSGNWSLMGA